VIDKDLRIVEFATNKTFCIEDARIQISTEWHNEKGWTYVLWGFMLIQLSSSWTVLCDSIANQHWSRDLLRVGLNDLEFVTTSCLFLFLFLPFTISITSTVSTTSTRPPPRHHLDTETAAGQQKGSRRVASRAPGMILFLFCFVYFTNYIQIFKVC
jgi:hypothetical protein